MSPLGPLASLYDEQNGWQSHHEARRVTGKSARGRVSILSITSPLSQSFNFVISATLIVLFLQGCFKRGWYLDNGRHQPPHMACEEAGFPTSS